MSSDSDLEYESADEDTTEHDTSEKENKIEEKIITESASEKSETYSSAENVDAASKVSKKSLAQKCEEELKSETNTNKLVENEVDGSITDVKVVVKTDSVLDSSSKDDSKKCLAQKYEVDLKESEINAKIVVETDSVLDSSSKDDSKKCLAQKYEVDHKESEINANKLVENEIAGSKTDVKVSPKDVKQEKRRVPLRREMKMQQKSLLCKKVLPDKEQLPKECLEESKVFLSKDSSDEKQSSTIVSEEKVIVEEKSMSSGERNDSNANVASSWGFGGWGSSLLSTAASSVTSFSNQVSQGLGTVLETVENTLGAPSPEELAAALKEKKNESNCEPNLENETEEEASSGILPGVSTWTKVFENTGSKVLMGGLDTLELIGKKTMDILTEGDPGLRSKRTIFSDRVNLSQILREAKEQADKENENNSASDSDVIHYSQIFDDQQGLVHLEALEMLSKQTQAKFQRLLMRHSRKEEVKKRIEEINRICENIPGLDDPTECEEFEDFESVFKKHVLELNLPLNVDNIVKTQKKLCDTLSKFENAPEEDQIVPDEIYRSSICSLAEFTARSIETFHKVAELILVQKNLSSDLELCATNLTGLTTVMCIEINNLSSKYHKCLDSSESYFSNYTNGQGLNITAMATNLYMEASNSNKYIQDAFQMIVPVLQVCLLESLEE